MGKVFVTSDLHLHHDNIIKFCNRPYLNVNDMNEALIDNWNSVVSKSDIVYVLGDFIMGKADNIDIDIKRFNGEIILIRGNHDYMNKKHSYLLNGVEVKEYEDMFYKGKHLFMFHYPKDVAIKSFGDNKDFSNVDLFLYGHVHDKAQKGLVDNTYHVGVDTNDFKPIEIDSIIGMM